MGWEFRLLYVLQDLHTPWMDRIMVFASGLANHGELWLILGAFCLCFPKTRRLGIAMFWSIGLGYITGNLILKNLFARSRPCIIDPQVPLLVQVPGGYSFPSGHTLVSFEGGMSVWNDNKKWGILALAAAVIIGFSRMYLFVHFPTDVLAGMVLGIINSRIVNYVMIRQSEKRGES